MKQGMQNPWWLGLALCGLLTGCVERRYLITSDPPGAIVYDEKGQPIGATPVDRQFVYYGKYRFTLVKDGCQTHVVEEPIRPPWFEWFPLDFFSENLLPWTVRDVRRLHYALPPAQLVTPESVLQEAQQLRARGQEITPVAPVPEQKAMPAPVLPPPGAGPP